MKTNLIKTKWGWASLIGDCECLTTKKISEQLPYFDHDLRIAIIYRLIDGSIIYVVDGAVVPEKNINKADIVYYNRNPKSKKLSNNKRRLRDKQFYEYMKQLEEEENLLPF